MNDLIKELASDPSCLLAITPEAGGSWLAPFRTRQPRNFAADPMTFTDSYTAQDGIGTDDFTLSVDFTLLRKNVHGAINIGCMQCIYYASTKGYQPFVRILKSDGTKSFLYPVGDSHMTGDIASIKVIKTGQNVRMVVHASDGSVVRDMTKPLPDGATVISMTNATNYPGNISAASIRNDTTGETVWQAAYSDLYDTSNPWPSPVPRNFAEEPATWYDWAVAAAQIGAHDFEWTIEYSYTEIPTVYKAIFYTNLDSQPFGVAVSANETQRITCTRLYEGDVQERYVVVSGYPQAGVPLVARVRRVGGTVTVYYNEALVGSYTSASAAIAPLFTYPMTSNFPGLIADMRLVDLTTGTTIAAYPSYAERLRLITSTNVLNTGTHFEAADTSTRWNVTTPLQAASLLPECTIIVDVDNSAGEIVSYVSCAQFLNPSQGFFVIRRQNSSQLYIGYSGRDSSGGNFYPGYYVSSPDGECTVALVIDYTSMKICCYINGVEVDNRTMHTNIVAQPEFDETAKPVILGATSGSDGLNSTTKISHCLIFDRALSAEEIALYSKIANS